MSDPTSPAQPNGEVPQAPDEPADDQGSEPQEVPSEAPEGERETGPAVVVRYGLMRHIGRFRHALDPAPPPGTNVVIRTDRGVELGRVISAVSDRAGCGAITPEQLAGYVESSGPDYPFSEGGKVLRVANRQDIIDHRHLQNQAREEATFCRQHVRQAKLTMRIITVEHLLGGERIVFYFTAESRVDFRELVRKLAAQYRTRIEMRQVGARDEARLVGDYERCGQRCCCQEFLKHLKPVSMRMAKMQKATLDPSKISGRCGRLMCCLRFEDATYDELRKTLPKRNTWVRTKDRIGRVTDTQILTQLLKLTTADGSVVVVGSDEVIERDVTPPAPPAPPGQRPREVPRPAEQPAPSPPPPEADQEAPQRPAPAEPPAVIPTQQQKDEAQREQEKPSAEPPTKRRKKRTGRRRRHDHKPKSARALPSASAAGGSAGRQPGKAPQSSPDSKKKRRRKRRRPKKE